MSRRKIREKVIDIDTESFTGHIDFIIDELRHIEEHATNSGYENLSIEIDYGYECFEFNLMGNRLETDKEMMKREKKEKKQKELEEKREENQKTRELKTLERLAKKYKKEII